MKTSLWGWMVFVSIWLIPVACKPLEQTPADLGQLAPTDTGEVIRGANSLATVSPTLNFTVDPDATATMTAVASPVEPNSIQPERTAEPFTFCSPLAWETIPELFEIVSDPYYQPPSNRPEERHHGVDFSHYRRKGYTTIEGEPIQAIIDGSVAAVIIDRLPYGNMVIIETPLDRLPEALIRKIGAQEYRSLYVLYAHMASAPALNLQEKVKCGQEIGEVGKTGYNIVNPHLHLETRLGDSGKVFQSMAFYTATATGEEMEAYTRWRTGGEFVHFDPMSLFQAYLEWLPLPP